MSVVLVVVLVVVDHKVVAVVFASDISSLAPLFGPPLVVFDVDNVVFCLPW